VVDADTHPAGVAGDVVNPIGRSAAKFGDIEVMNAYRLGRSLGAQLAASILKIVKSLAITTP